MENFHQSSEQETPAYHPFKYCLRYKPPQRVQSNVNEMSGYTSSSSSNGSGDTSSNSNSVTVQTDNVSCENVENDICEKVKEVQIESTKNRLQPDPNNSKVIKNGQNTDGNKTNTIKSNIQSKKENPKLFSKPLKGSNKINSNTKDVTYIKSPPQHEKISPPAKSKPRWMSNPFRSFITTGSTKISQQSPLFSYDLSRDELKCILKNSLKPAMKPPKDHELQLLKTGQRLEYLNQRYTQAPECKYNYPEATSWRIGWMHNVN